MCDGQLTSDVYPAPIRQPNVDEDDVGVQIADHGQGGVAVVGLTDDDDVTRCLEHLACPGAQHLVIVDDEHPDDAVVAGQAQPPAGRHSPGRC